MDKHKAIIFNPSDIEYYDDFWLQNGIKLKDFKPFNYTPNNNKLLILDDTNKFKTNKYAKNRNKKSS